MASHRLLFFYFIILFLCSVNAQTYSVRDYGAVGDGKTVDTAAIQKALDACVKTNGGDVLFPGPFTYLTYPISFSVSNTRLIVEKGATIAAYDNIDGWPVSGGSYVHFITSNKLTNITITGAGTIDGRGRVWWDRFTNNTLKYNRPNLVRYEGSKQCLIEEVTVMDSPNHTLEIYCDFTEIRFVNILAPGEGHYNTDGIDVHGSPFYVHDSYISVGDDLLAIHSNDTLVENCDFGDGHGVSIGGGYLGNITVRNSTFTNTLQATRIKTRVEESGLVSNIVYENLRMYNVGYAVCIDMFYQNLPQFAECLIGDTVADTNQKISDVVYRNIVATATKTGGIIVCQPSSPCHNIQLIDVSITGSPSPPWICMNAHGTASNVNPPTCLI